MPQDKYLPEGRLIMSEENRAATESLAALERTRREGRIAEGRAVMCTETHDLIVDIGGIRGVVPRAESAIGIDDGSTREIAVISRVGKPICFKVTDIIDGMPYLSRKEAQAEALAHLLRHSRPGDVLDCRVTHIESFGAFVDIGCGNISLIGIENISVSRIANPRERFTLRQDIHAVVKGIDCGRQRLLLSHRELLGTWKENAACIRAGTTLRGVVRGVEDYGIFVELAPNLSGLAERVEGVHPGMPVSVYVKAVIPEKMKIKLMIIDALEGTGARHITEEDYFIRSGCIAEWLYSPEECKTKSIKTDFTAP